MYCQDGEGEWYAVERRDSNSGSWEPVDFMPLLHWARFQYDQEKTSKTGSNGEGRLWILIALEKNHGVLAQNLCQNEMYWRNSKTIFELTGLVEIWLRTEFKLSWHPVLTTSDHKTWWKLPILKPVSNVARFASSIDVLSVPVQITGRPTSSKTDPTTSYQI